MPAAQRNTRTSRGARRRGALLLEVMLSLALFVSAGSAVLAIVSQAMGSLQATRERLRGLDLARSALAEIEAGIATPGSLNGSVAVWADPDDAEPQTGPADLAGGVGRQSGWELRIDTEPSSFDGLTLVTVTAVRTGSLAGAGYTLRQLVRLSAEADDTIGEQDEITKAAVRGARRERQTSESGRRQERGEAERRGTPREGRR